MCERCTCMGRRLAAENTWKSKTIVKIFLNATRLKMNANIWCIVDAGETGYVGGALGCYCSQGARGRGTALGWHLTQGAKYPPFGSASKYVLHQAVRGSFIASKLKEIRFIGAKWIYQRRPTPPFPHTRLKRFQGNIARISREQDWFLWVPNIIIFFPRANKNWWKRNSFVLALVPKVQWMNNMWIWNKNSTKTTCSWPIECEFRMKVQEVGNLMKSKPKTLESTSSNIGQNQSHFLGSRIDMWFYPRRESGCPGVTGMFSSIAGVATEAKGPGEEWDIAVPHHQGSAAVTL